MSSVSSLSDVRSAELYRRAARVLPGGVNSPVRAMRAIGRDPIFIERAAGAEITDVDGNTYVDYVCSWGPMILGHAHPAVLEAIGEAAALFGEGMQLWAEPGRALVAGGGSVVVQVQLRRGDALYVNDGVYGSLSDAGHPGFRFPARRVPVDGAAESKAKLRAFALYGPTCDSADYMKGPFLLPEDIDEGDWIELGQLGAYGSCLRTRFNGFDSTLTAEVVDPPLLATPGYEG